MFDDLCNPLLSLAYAIRADHTGELESNRIQAFQRADLRAGESNYHVLNLKNRRELARRPQLRHWSKEQQIDLIQSPPCTLRKQQVTWTKVVENAKVAL